MSKIKVQRTKMELKEFSKIEIGGLFFDPDYPEEIYQKTIPVKDATFPNEKEILNAALIAGDEKGNIVHFDDDEHIVPIDIVTISY